MYAVFSSSQFNGRIINYGRETIIKLLKIQSVRGGKKKKQQLKLQIKKMFT